MLLQPRDIEILRQVGKHRLLRSTHIAELVGGSSQHLLRRLGLLFHHGYLERPPEQINYYSRGSQPMVYRLSRKGQQTIAKHFPSSVPQTPSSGTSTLFMQHTLRVSDVMVNLEKSCIQENIRLLEEDSLAAYIPKEHMCSQPFAWRVRIGSIGKECEIGMVPDRTFTLQPMNTRQPATAVFFLEVDRGTMPITRRDYVQSSIERKILGYVETWRQQIHIRHFGFSRFCVLFMMEGSQRLQNAVAVAKSRTQAMGGAGLFLFQDIREISKQLHLSLLPRQSVRRI